MISRTRLFAAALLLALPQVASGQDPLSVELAKPILTPDAAAEQHRQFVLARIPKLKLAASAEKWTEQAEQIRQRVLREVVFRGVPASWREGRPEVVYEQIITTEHGYRIRKLRYEALPGLWIPALLYEPDNLVGKRPAVLNVNGHERIGKSVDYKQTRCINLAKRGVLALNLEWIGMGQLRTEGLSHNHLGKLDLCGRSGLSVFYLAMSRGLDVLVNHPHTDRERVAVTGLSGGGWQTIILSSLDKRVTLATPVAGHSSLTQRVANRSSIGDLEQNPNDLVSIADYVHLNALMTPRPLLLIYNTKDNCCFVASTVKANTYEPVIPFYEQAKVADALRYYENSDPGTHNYQLDNRQQFYRFLNRHFFKGQESRDDEIPCAAELRKHEELLVKLPARMADFHTLAADVAAGLPKSSTASPDDRRKHLAEIIRYRPAKKLDIDNVGDPATVGGLSVQRMLLKFRDWSVPVVLVQSKKSQRTTVVVADGGFASQAKRIRELAESGHRVYALDLVLHGQSAPTGALAQNAMLMSTVGARPLGEQAAQLLAMTQLLAQQFIYAPVHLRSFGPRTTLASQVASAIDGGATIKSLSSEGGPSSLKEYLKPSASYGKTPEAYCFGLLEWFDVGELQSLGAKTR